MQLYSLFYGANGFCFFDKEVSSVFFFFFIDLLELERRILWIRIMFILFTSLGGTYKSHSEKVKIELLFKEVWNNVFNLRITI